MRRGMVIGKVVSQVVCIGAPMNDKVAMGHSIANPIKKHVDGLGAALFNRNCCQLEK
jgi:hypothetical protein